MTRRICCNGLLARSCSLIPREIGDHCCRLFDRAPRGAVFEACVDRGCLQSLMTRRLPDGGQPHAMHHLLRRPRAICWESRSRHPKLAIGLDNASNWVTPSEQDVDEWPNGGLSPLPGQPDVSSCDVTSAELFARSHAFRGGRKNLGLPDSARLPRNGFPEWLIASSG